MGTDTHHDADGGHEKGFSTPATPDVAGSAGAATAGAGGLTEHVRADSFAALDALIDAVRGLPDDAFSAPSALPDWTRGHVLAHVDGVANALARQAEFAARGERVQPYDGGAEGRNAAIEAGSTRSLAEHVAALTTARERLAGAWPEPESPLWDAPTSYRDGPVTGCLLAWWREARIHAVDAVVGIGFDSWDARLQAHLRDFLAGRVPEGVTLSDGGAVGPGQSHSGTVVLGDPVDIAAWLAGRQSVGPVRAIRADAEVPVPELGPMPSAQR